MEKCSCEYARKGDLKFHYKQKHAVFTDILYTNYPELSRKRSTKEKKQYCCPVEQCPCGYGRLCDLKNHFILRHPESLDKHPKLKPVKLYQCGLCNQLFARQQVLNRHFVKLHNNSTLEDNFVVIGESSADEESEDTMNTQDSVHPPSPPNPHGRNISTRSSGKQAKPHITTSSSTNVSTLSIVECEHIKFKVSFIVDDQHSSNDSSHLSFDMFSSS